PLFCLHFGRVEPRSIIFMNISYNWLKELIDIDLPPKLLAEQLTLVGLELDGLHQIGEDHIFDIEVTSNRGDCLSHLGVAREISAFSDKDVISPHSRNEQPDTNDPNLVKIESPDACLRFTARIIRDVKIGPSPKWLVERLEAIGERSINNAADISNFVMHELGQPMHVFDLNKVEGRSIIVRYAKSGEKITTLDEVERELSTSMVVVCDKSKPLAVGGVMGGFDSGVTDDTTDILLEVAYFDRDNIRETSRALNLSTEASYHFERGVDIENLVKASNRAAELICELAGGTAAEFVDVYPTKAAATEIEAPCLKDEVRRLSGLDVEDAEISRILSKLGLEKLSETKYKSPTWRHDLAIDEDLVEEVVRIVGYDKVGEELPYALSAGEYQPSEIRKRKLRQTLASIGFDEGLSYSFIDERHDQIFEIVPGVIGGDEIAPFISIKDPIIEGSSRMRPTLLPGLLSSARVNFNHQNRNLKLYEIGKVFANSGSEVDLPDEVELMGLLITGELFTVNAGVSAHTNDFFDLKGAIDSAIDSLNAAPLLYKSADIKHLQKGQSAELFFEDKKVGFAGLLNDEITASYKFRQNVFVAEIALQTILEAGELPSNYQPLPVFPGVTRDISMQIKRTLSFDDVKEAIREMNFELCRNVEFADVFEGKGLPDDERSLTIRLEYRSDERTLTEEEVEKIHEQILSGLKVTLGIRQR
ncbi:MAG: phenylalanine--tRNA ligase subunit beta, partial [Acidobacteria bacterium]|nr:phenylalanine--tRNA ligase subunit beta [Acidobacteriota bacterium]